MPNVHKRGIADAIDLYKDNLALREKFNPNSLKERRIEEITPNSLGMELFPDGEKELVGTIKTLDGMAKLNGVVYTQLIEVDLTGKPYRECHKTGQVLTTKEGQIVGVVACGEKDSIFLIAAQDFFSNLRRVSYLTPAEKFNL